MIEVSFIPSAFIMELIHPPLNHPDRILKEVFLEVSEPHRYSSFQLVGGRPGAVLASGDRRHCEILTDRLIIREERTESTFRDFAQDSLNLVDAVRRRVPIPIFLTTAFTIRSLVPLPPNQTDSVRLLVEKCWKMPSESFSSFNRPLGGIGFRFVFPPVQEDRSEVQVRLEPSFGDRRMLFVEIHYRFFNPVQTREELEKVAETVYDFQSRQVADFLNQMVREESL
ncbi:MAG TPA: hypothetical protein PKH07_09485 [bacterium]|nr:hypothetical protein [bacterium]